MIIITIPKFTTDKETANFWDNHSFEDYSEDTEESKIKFICTSPLASQLNEDKEKIISRKENPHEKIY